MGPPKYCPALVVTMGSCLRGWLTGIKEGGLGCDCGSLWILIGSILGKSTELTSVSKIFGRCRNFKSLLGKGWRKASHFSFSSLPFSIEDREKKNSKVNTREKLSF